MKFQMAPDFKIPLLMFLLQLHPERQAKQLQLLVMGKQPLPFRRHPVEAIQLHIW
jgi:hypothetical protein